MYSPGPKAGRQAGSGGSGSGTTYVAQSGWHTLGITVKTLQAVTAPPTDWLSVESITCLQIFEVHLSRGAPPCLPLQASPLITPVPPLSSSFTSRFLHA
ncbi:hypothetical protein E2C01_064196 [Portunus trituberculatus]|uniref:Uncharacterized protein n=1 Tax=Portunus trituberculatus TaxID=210409 RepID=A0A5B7HIF3_PORTR|nr:hypothetical protein [Portunus trituberculatus]